MVTQDGKPERVRPIALRDRIAHRLANAALRIATPWYRDLIAGLIRYGMKSAVRDAAPQPDKEDSE